VSGGATDDDSGVADSAGDDDVIDVMIMLLLLFADATTFDALDEPDEQHQHQHQHHQSAKDLKQQHANKRNIAVRQKRRFRTDETRRRPRVQRDGEIDDVADVFDRRKRLQPRQCRRVVRRQQLQSVFLFLFLFFFIDSISKQTKARRKT
jgi:hypothetical protein